MDEKIASPHYEMGDPPGSQSDAQPFGRNNPLYASVERAAAKWKNLTNTRRVDSERSTNPNVQIKNTPFQNLKRTASCDGLVLWRNQRIGKEEVDGKNIDETPVGNLTKDTLNMKLLLYVRNVCAKASADASSIDYRHIKSLVEEGADINCGDIYGQTILHEVARLWHTDVAKYLIHELKADPNKGDNWGRTPLHVAAYVGYAEMCSCLIEAGADKEARTKGERQTPLFFAARGNTAESLKCLINHDCEFEQIVDYKERTPLRVAILFGCYNTVQCLLDNGAPVDVRDDSGQPVIVPLMLKMPTLAYDALDQFYDEDRITKTECHYLSKLEPTTLDEADESKYPSVLEVIAINRLYQLVIHPSIRHLTDFSWRSIARSRAYFTLVLQFIFITCWSIVPVAKNWKDLHKYNFPDEFWRMIVITIGLSFFSIQIMMEIYQFTATKRRFLNWEEWRKKCAKEDLHYCHPQWRNEREWIENEAAATNFLSYTYRTLSLNIYGWLCYLMMAASIVSHVEDLIDHSLLKARWHIRLIAVTVLMLWIRFMKDLRHVDWVGSFIVILGNLLEKILKFVIVYLIFYIPFSIAFWILLGGKTNIPEFYITNATTIDEVPIANITVEHFEQYHNVLHSLFLLTLVVDFDLKTMLQIDEVMSQMLVGSWLAISAILCINLFIALLSDTFLRVHDNAKATAGLEKAKTIVNIIQSWPADCTRKYYRQLQEKGGRYFVRYDPTKRVSTEKEMQKATIEVRDSVNELKDQFKSVLNESSDAVTEQKYDKRTSNRLRPSTETASGLRRNSLTTSSIRISTTEDAFAGEIQRLRRELETTRNEQVEMKETIKKEIASVRDEVTSMNSLLKDISMVMTGGLSPFRTEEKKKKKKKRTRSSEHDGDATGDGGTLPSTVIQVVPVTHPSITSDGSAFLPPVNFPDPGYSEDV